MENPDEASHNNALLNQWRASKTETHKLQSLQAEARGTISNGHLIATYSSDIRENFIHGYSINCIIPFFPESRTKRFVEVKPSACD